MATAQWSINQLAEEHAPLGEASHHIQAYERRIGKKGEGQMRMLTEMLYSNVLPATTKNIVLARSWKDGVAGR